jgi:hypothetical protein
MAPSSPQCSGEIQTWKAPASGGTAVQVTRDGGYEGIESPDGKFVYFLKGSPLQLWRVPAGGGEVRQVLEPLHYPMDLTPAGLFRAETGSIAACSSSPLRLCDGSTKQIADLGQQQMGAEPGAIKVSSDGRTLVYTRSESRGIDLMLVENFR